MKEELEKEEAGVSNDNKEHYLLSRNFNKKWTNYVWQSAIAGVFSIIFLYIFSELVSLIILASVGSTFFNVFALPTNRTASPRNVIGSYLICVLIGLSCFYLFPNIPVSGGVAVGAAAFFMVITDTEHPPAAGIALGLAVTPKAENLSPEILFVIFGALLAALLKHILSPWLKDLT